MRSFSIAIAGAILIVLVAGFIAWASVTVQYQMTGVGLYEFDTDVLSIDDLSWGPMTVVGHKVRKKASKKAGKRAAVWKKKRLSGLDYMEEAVEVLYDDADSWVNDVTLSYDQANGMAFSAWAAGVSTNGFGEQKPVLWRFLSNLWKIQELSTLGGPEGGVEHVMRSRLAGEMTTVLNGWSDDPGGEKKATMWLMGAKGMTTTTPLPDNGSGSEAHHAAVAAVNLIDVGGLVTDLGGVGWPWIWEVSLGDTVRTPSRADMFPFAAPAVGQITGEQLPVPPNAISGEVSVVVVPKRDPVSPSSGWAAPPQQQPEKIAGGSVSYDTQTSFPMIWEKEAGAWQYIEPPLPGGATGGAIVDGVTVDFSSMGALASSALEAGIRAAATPVGQGRLFVGWVTVQNSTQGAAWLRLEDGAWIDWAVQEPNPPLVAETYNGVSSKGDIVGNGYPMPAANAFTITESVALLDSTGPWGFVTSPVQPSGIKNPPPLWSTLSVEAYPNPFNPVVTIVVHPARSGYGKVTIHDVAGRRVATLFDDHVFAGEEPTLTWDGTLDRGQRAASGVYFVRVQVAGDIASRKIVMAK